MVDLTQFVEFDKFCKCRLNKWFRSNDVTVKRPIAGCFKEVGSDELVQEIFEARELQGGDAMETYEAYIAYFNRTLRLFEKERIAVSARFLEKEDI